MSFGVHLDRKTCHCLSCTDTTAGGPVSSTHPVSTETCTTLSGFCQPLTVSAPKGGVWVHTQTLLEMPSTPCTEASPSLMAGAVCWFQRAMTHFANELHFQTEVLVRVRVSLYLAPYKGSRAKLLPPRACSVKKNKLLKPGLVAKSRKTPMSRELHLLSVLCAHKEQGKHKLKPLFCLSQALDLFLGHSTQISQLLFFSSISDPVFLFGNFYFV